MDRPLSQRNLINIGGTCISLLNSNWLEDHDMSCIAANTWMSVEEIRHILGGVNDS